MRRLACLVVLVLAGCSRSAEQDPGLSCRGWRGDCGFWSCWPLRGVPRSTAVMTTPASHIVSRTTPLLTVEEVDQALGAPDIGFRGPGQ